IHSAFQTDLSLDDLAHAAAMSRYHFLRCFKTHVGSTPYAYLHQVRLQHAAALLRSSSRGIHLRRDILWPQSLIASA
ncbi:MAG: helix-turn-helix domain-containing protein, partial [Pseudomonadota bacterium]|nr:helix-turn-helix domain-containing protein [Pseudomonadota bacterium]